MSQNTPINRNRFITVYDTDAERPVTAIGFPFGQSAYSLDTNELRISDGTAVWPPPIGGPGSIRPFSRTLYVDGGTVTPPALANGSVALPYKTIMAAVAAMVGGTVIVVMPGVYQENVVWRDLDNTALLGISQAGVIISPLTGDAFAWTPLAGAAITNFTLDNITLKVTNPGDRALVLDGINTANFLTGLGQFRASAISHPGGGDAIFVRRVNQFRILNSVNFAGGDTHFVNVSEGIIQGPINSNGALVVDWDDTQPIPTQGRNNTILLQTTVVGQLVLKGAPFVIVSKDAIVLFSITDAGLVFDGGTGNAPVLLFSGDLGLFGLIPGGITLAYPTVPAGQSALSFDGAGLAGPIVLTVAAGPRLPVSARGVVWRDDGAGSVSLGDFIDMDARDSSYRQQSIFTVSGGVDTGTLDRDTWNIYDQPDFAVATPIPIFPPFPAGTTEYVVTVNTKDPVVVAIPRAGKLANQFTAEPSGATGPTDFGIVRARAT
jgi:hypothetical protein